MKNKFLKRALSMFLSMLLLSSFNTFAATDYTLLKYELNGGVGNWGYTKRYYWIDTSASDIASIIDKAYNSWINTSDILSTPISWRKTSTKANGTVEFYTYNSADGNNGYTSFWLYSTSIDPDKQNWGWCTVYYNNRYNAGRATLAHEIGHTMGLDENNSNPKTIMCQASANRSVTTPRLGDLKGINKKYN